MKESYSTQKTDLDTPCPNLTDEQKRLVAALDSEDFNATAAVALSSNDSFELDEKLHAFIDRVLTTEQQRAMAALANARPRLIVSYSPSLPSIADVLLEHEKRSQDVIAKQIRNERGCRGMRKPQFLHDNAPSLHARYSKKHGRL
jgi:hypothetical protein